MAQEGKNKVNFFQFITFISFSFKNHIKVFSVKINETKAQ